MTVAQTDTRTGSSPSIAGAWRFRRAWVVLCVTTAAAAAVDLLSKWWAFAVVAGTPIVLDRAEVLNAAAVDPRAVSTLIPAHAPVRVVPGLLEFTLVLNPGAVFGIGPGQRVFFIAFTLAAFVFGVWMFGSWTRARDHAAHAAIGLLIGGGIGNLYDRLVYACVRDFIHPLPRVRFPAFVPGVGSREVWPYVSNVADLLLLIGIGMLVVYLWRRDGSARRSGIAEANAEDGEAAKPLAGASTDPESDQAR